jgi:two-component system LytT family response regulator
MIPLRVVIADDERPARAFLASLLRSWEDVEIVGEAERGDEAVELIERLRPDLALLDLQMPELDGMGVVRMLRRDRMPLIAFVTAFDEYAVRAFEMNAVDYLLKPVEPARLRHTLTRVQERLEHANEASVAADRVAAAAAEYERRAGRETPYLRRIPVRRTDDIVFVSVEQVASIVADGELLHLTTMTGERHTITYRLKDLAARLDPHRFVRVSRGALANLDAVVRVSPMPGGTYVLMLSNRQRLTVSRLDDVTRTRDVILPVRLVRRRRVERQHEPVPLLDLHLRPVRVRPRDRCGEQRQPLHWARVVERHRVELSIGQRRAWRNLERPAEMPSVRDDQHQMMRRAIVAVRGDLDPDAIVVQQLA